MTVLVILAFAGLDQWTVQAAALGDIARNVQSELVTLDAGLNVAQSRKSRKLNLDVPAGKFKTKKLILLLPLFQKMICFSGGAVDMFYRYGFFSLSVRVVPRDDPGSWLIREPTADIFDRQSVVISETAGPDTLARQPFQVNLFDRQVSKKCQRKRGAF